MNNQKLISRYATMKVFIARVVVLVICIGLLPAVAQNLGNHPAVYDARGVLQPWTSWPDALGREVEWYLSCPLTNG